MNPIELVWGWIRFYRNEVAIDSKPEIDDPPAARLGAFGRVYGKVSGDHLVPNPDGGTDPRRLEKVLWQFKEDENFPGQHGGCVTLHLQRPGTEDDANMVPVLTLTSAYARVYVPLRTDLAPSRLQSANGRYRCVMQDDGNLVVYDGPRAVWSQWTGRLPIDRSADTGADVPGGGAP